jgi:hypothetical protein
LLGARLGAVDLKAAAAARQVALERGVREELGLREGARLPALALQRRELLIEASERLLATVLVAPGLVLVAGDDEAPARLALADPHLLDMQALLDELVAALARERGAVLRPVTELLAEDVVAARAL